MSYIVRYRGMLKGTVGRGMVDHRAGSPAVRPRTPPSDTLEGKIQACIQRD